MRVQSMSRVAKMRSKVSQAGVRLWEVLVALFCHEAAATVRRSMTWTVYLKKDRQKQSANKWSPCNERPREEQMSANFSRRWGRTKTKVLNKLCNWLRSSFLPSNSKTKKTRFSKTNHTTIKIMAWYKSKKIQKRVAKAVILPVQTMIETETYQPKD